MYDEKWFWGLVTRQGEKPAKNWGSIAIFQAYHKSHINKTMGVKSV
jgi:hypothetical protein